MKLLEDVIADWRSDAQVLRSPQLGSRVMTDREHVTDGTGCWCNPTPFVVCDECHDGCWKCGVCGLREVSLDEAQTTEEPLIIVHGTGICAECDRPEVCAIIKEGTAPCGRNKPGVPLWSVADV